MTDVFISYSHEDQEFVRKLVRALEAEDLSVWWDHTIPPGQSWESHIERHILAAKACIVVWSPVSIASDWVKEEATTAQQAGKFLPIRTQDAVQPPMGFRRVQAASFENWRGQPDSNSWQLLIGEVRKLVGGDQGGATTAVRQPAPRPVSQQKHPPWIAIAAAVAALALVTVVTFFTVNSMSRSATPQAAWLAVDQSDAAALRAFISGDPGEYRDEAQTALISLEQSLFEAARESDDLAAYETFLTDFPESEHVILARGRAAELRGQSVPDSDLTAPTADPAASRPQLPSPEQRIEREVRALGLERGTWYLDFSDPDVALSCAQQYRLSIVGDELRGFVRSNRSDRAQYTILLNGRRVTRVEGRTVWLRTSGDDASFEIGRDHMTLTESANSITTIRRCPQ